MDTVVLPSALSALTLNVQRFQKSPVSRRLPFDIVDSPRSDSKQSSLPANHFLSQSLETLARSEEPRFLEGRLDTSSLGAADFDVDVSSGFLPPEQPIQRLEGPCEIWESLWDASYAVNLHDDSVTARRWRQQVMDLPIVTTEHLKTLPYLRRAHLILAFLTHRYIHSQPVETEGRLTVPASISEPFLAVSERLDMPPILTYADTVLWNWRLIKPQAGLRSDNFELVNTFTNTIDERHFYYASLVIEWHGVNALRLMANSLDEAFVNDGLAHSRIATYLFALANTIDDLSEAMKSVKTDCDPLTFYNDIRPWFNGGKWLHQRSSNLPPIEKDLGGPSAGQSSLVHALDVFLTIDHSDRRAASGEEEHLERLEHNETFMTRMSLYMPHHHRHFLRHLAQQIPSIRDIALQTSQQSILREAYNGTIDAMRRFREAHTWVVSKYIIAPSRLQQQKELKESQLKGTGGTNIVAFLRRTRDRTMEARLPV